MRMPNAERISQLIAGKLLERELTSEEIHEFEQWLETSPENKALFEKIKDGKAAFNILELERQQYGEKMAVEFGKNQGFRKPGLLQNRLYWWAGSVAAAIALIVTVGLFVQPGTMPPVKEKLVAQQEIVPGQVHAILTMADGQSVDITDSGKGAGDKDHSSGIYAALKSSEKTKTAAGNKPIYHSLSVPAGGEFSFTLPDSTKVWLNSKTDLRFPSAFTDNERKVYLKGEAFFEVAKDKDKAFIISLSDGDVTVYGTRFNITDYEETPLSAVLVEGSIGFVSGNGKSVKLKPSERMVYETSTGAISIQTVDVTPYTAWVNKMFIFNGQRLENIMATLSRWYDVNVYFASDDIKAVRLSGKLYRHEDIRILLKTYEEAADIRFNIEGKNITVAKK